MNPFLYLSKTRFISALFFMFLIQFCGPLLLIRRYFFMFLIQFCGPLLSHFPTSMSRGRDFSQEGHLSRAYHVTSLYLHFLP
jgi:hypothetical protein